ncbi:tryptophan synthase beta subunit-like PLP-dependent enzyme, partial [Ochromonadaceae sp. CCMP2298]
MTGEGECRLHAFVMSAGTGGTIAGVSRYLKARDRRIRVYLADPYGSSLLSKVRYNVCFAPQQTERTLKRHRYDSVVEGVGLDRVTANFNMAFELQPGGSTTTTNTNSNTNANPNPSIDGGFCVSDQEAVDLAHWLLREEGLFVGSSSALNLAAAVRAAREIACAGVGMGVGMGMGGGGSVSDAGAGAGAGAGMGAGAGNGAVRVVTVICDSGHRHMSRFWSEDFFLQHPHYGVQWPNTHTIPACLRNPPHPQ